MESVLITGANRGIGYALAKALVATDFRVFAGCRNTENTVSLQKLGAAHGDLLQVLPLDVSSDDSVNAGPYSRRQHLGVDPFRLKKFELSTYILLKAHEE